ncbi:MAG: hypothetical protein ACYS18_01950 [Planctomycetota bacterium]
MKQGLVAETGSVRESSTGGERGFARVGTMGKITGLWRTKCQTQAGWALD